MDRRAILRWMSLGGAAVGLYGKRSLAAADDSPQDISVNQVGYLPTSEKIAGFPADNRPGRVFHLESNSGGGALFQGTLSTPSTDAASGVRVALADFSQYTHPGIYQLVSGSLRSRPFVIGASVYQRPLELSVRAFYGQRCGCAVDLGDGYRHPSCHLTGAYHPSSGRDGSVANHGGWHDAGDYGRYVVNSNISVSTLLWAWELYPRALRKLSLDIPESGGKLPDYLAEIRWCLEWMLSLQDADGGVWHKQTSEQFCGFIMPQDDHLTSYVIGTGAPPYKSTCATAGFAASMAVAARCYGAYDTAFAARCLLAARHAYTWAVAHPSVTFDNPPGIGTGSYADAHCGDELLWASAELWRTTGEAQYEQAFLAATQALPPESAIAAPSWNNVAPLAYWTYVLSERPGDAAMRSRILSKTAEVARSYVGRRQLSGFGNTLRAEDYIWGSNSVAANQSLLLLVANQLKPDRQLLEAALGNLHYLLGRNCFAVSWVTQVGTNPFLHPHHRPSAADGIAAPWPGLLSGGPNARPADKVALALPKLPPMRMWEDDQAAYSLNEVAINWNAPFVFLLAAANSG
jgi:endoglucanase